MNKGKSTNIRKILVIQTAFIGDAILSTSVLEELHHHLPDAELHLIVRKGNETLFTAHPYLKKLWVWNKKENKYGNLIALIAKLRREKYDLAVNLQRFLATGIITGLSGADITAGFDKNPLSFLFSNAVKHIYNKHETERNHELIRFITGGKTHKPKLYPSPADEAFTAEYKDHAYITIAPASVWYTKQFPPEKWIEFLQSIHKPLKIYLLGGPGDAKLCNEIKNATTNALLNIEVLAGKFSFLQTASVMRDALMNYVNDSAPLHIASSVNAPVRAVFCSTVKSFGFGPLSDNSDIIETELELKCRPCGLHGKKACPLGHFNCAMSIHIPVEF